MEWVSVNRTLNKKQIEKSTVFYAIHVKVGKFVECRNDDLNGMNVFGAWKEIFAGF